MTSTRLPRKILKRIGGKRIIDHCIDNVKKAILVDRIIVASPHKIPGINVGTFIGDEKDVLRRYYECATLNHADVIVRITSDCPFVSPDAIDMAIEFYFANPQLGYVSFAPVDGMDVEVFGYKELEDAFLNATEPYDREHVTPFIRKVKKLSVDTLDDLKNARRFYGLKR